MATLRSYSATFEQTGLAGAAVARYRFNDSFAAVDNIHGLDGSFHDGAGSGAAGLIGDGAASFDGSSDYVLVETLSGTLRIATLGDSLATGRVSGNGGFQAAGQTFADDLPAALEARGLTVAYFDHAVPGDRTSDGFARTVAVTDDAPDVVILELGTNDALAQVDPATVEATLRSIIADLQSGGVDQILLTGTFGFFPQISGGRGYDTEGERAAFEGRFAAIAADTPNGVVLLNDGDGSDKFLGGVRTAGTIDGGVLDSDDASLRNGDGLHPNAAGIDAIVARVVPQTIALGHEAGVISEPLLLANGAFEMLFTIDHLDQRQMLFAKNSVGQGTGGQVAAFVTTHGSLVFSLGDGIHDIAAASAAGVVTPGAPVHLVANFGAGGMEVFVNGAPVASDDYTGGLDAGLGNFEPLVIGAGNGLATPGTGDVINDFFSGTIDEFGIYDRALTADEVQQLFDGCALGTTVLGSAQADTLVGGSDAEVLRGAGGNDTIDGHGGDDELRGGGGDDGVHGGPGDDDLLGGRGTDALHGGADDDALAGKDGGDVLAGGSGNDVLEGGDGADVISGADGDDQLFGNRGLDDLRGGLGNDLLNGGNGRDELTGGAGEDTFQIDKIAHGVDRILDFSAGGGDVLDLSAVLDFGGGNPGDFVRLAEVNGNTRVEVNADGAGDDFTAVFNLNGTTGLSLDSLVDDGNVQLNAPTS